MRSRTASATAAPTSSCRAPCCSGSTSAPASFSRWTSSPPTPRTDWSQDDFIPSLLAANRWTGHFGDPLGTGPLLEIPVNCESYNLTYVPEHLERHGLEVPATWDAYFATAEERLAAPAARAGIRPARQGGVAHDVHGLRDADLVVRRPRLRRRPPLLDRRPEVVAPTQRFIEALRAAGPRRWTEQRWYELALDFARGPVRADRRLRPLRRDLRGSGATRELAGRIGYAPPPAGPDGAIAPNLWTWSLVMNARFARQGGGVALHRVGIEPGVPAALGLRGQHEPDARERVGRPARRRARVRLGRLRRRLAPAHREARARPRHAGDQLHRHRRALGARAPRRVRRNEGDAEALERAAADIDELDARAADARPGRA